MYTDSKPVQLRLGKRVIDFFRSLGRGHITRMQDVLSTYVHAQMLGNDSGEPALITAAHQDNIVAAQTLLAAGADPNAVDSAGCSALGWAVRYNRINMAILLLSAGADPNSESVRPGGLSVLMEVCGEGRVQLLLALLAAGANPDLQSTPSMKTALMMAAARGRLQVVKLLLAAGADLSLNDIDGNTALTLAEIARHVGFAMGDDPKHIEVVRVLESTKQNQLQPPKEPLNFLKK
jgi:ankyrin repeat protein